MENLKAVIWDVDGTLADTEMNGHRLAFNKAFKDNGLAWEWNEEIYAKLLGVSGGKNRILKYSYDSKDFLSLEFAEKLHKQKQEHYINIIKQTPIPLRTGVKEIVTELNSASIVQCIVTTSSLNSLIPLMESSLSELRNYFSFMVTYEDVLNHKPHPEAYLLALSKIPFPKANCLVIEDSVIGLQSSSQADITTLVTLSPWLNTVSEKFKPAKAVVKSLGDSSMPSKVYKGPSIRGGIVNLEYLDQLVRN